MPVLLRGLPLRRGRVALMDLSGIWSKSASLYLPLPRFASTSSSTSQAGLRFTTPRASQRESVLDRPLVFNIVQEKVTPWSSSRPASQPIPPLSPRHIRCWNLWQLDGLSLEQIEKKLHIKKETIFNHLVICIKNGIRIDWVDICKEVALTPDVVRILQQASRLVSDGGTLLRCCPRNSVTDSQCTLFRTMQFCKMTDEQIMLASCSAALPTPVLESFKDKLSMNSYDEDDLAKDQAGSPFLNNQLAVAEWNR